jgi:tight adherence protein B
MFHKLLSNNFFFIVSFSICVATIAYFSLSKYINKAIEKSAESRREILRLLDLMFVETNETKINQLLLLMSCGLGIVVFFVLWPHFWIGLAAGLVVGFVGWNTPLRLIKAQFEKRSTLFTEQMIDGLTIMANGIKAGLTVPQAMERVVENLANPISQEFNLVLSEIRLGRSVEEALTAMSERIPRPDVQMFVTAVNILRETGGNLAETFQTIVLVIRERQKVERKIEAMTAQAMTQGMIISAVPLALIALFFVMDPAFIKPMFTTALGLVIFMMILGLVLIGGTLMRKIVKIDV